MNLVKQLIAMANEDVFVDWGDAGVTIGDDHGVLSASKHSDLMAQQGEIETLYQHLAIDSNEQLCFLSYEQQRLWFVDKISPIGSEYNIPQAFRLDGQLDVASLQRAFDGIIERHQVLRTVYRTDPQGDAYQIMHDPMPLVLGRMDVSSLADEAQQIRVAQIAREEGDKPYNLAEDLMLRATLVKLSAEQHVLLVTMHHIASDGWSMEIMTRELAQLYQAYTSGADNPLAPLPIQFSDFAHWQRQWLQGDVLTRQLDYWKQHLADLPLVHSLPLDFPRPANASNRGEMFEQQLPLVLQQQLNQLAQSQQATLFMVLNTALASLVSRYSGQTDIVIGCPVSNREQGEVAPLIGFFVNSLILRSDLSDDPTFVQLLAQSKQGLLAANAHQQVPFERLVDELKVERSLGYNPLFQMMLTLDNQDNHRIELPDLVLNKQPQQVSSAKFDLNLHIAETPQGLCLSWTYATDLFRHQTIVQLSAHFAQLLSAVVAAPDSPINQYPLLSPEQQHQQLHQWNQTYFKYPAEQSIDQLFLTQAQLNPDAIAVLEGDEKFSYQDLEQQSNQLAHYLLDQGITPGERVGICVGRSIGLILAQLAVLKSGACYVPLDPTYPEERLEYMLEDSEIEVVLTSQSLFGSVELLNDYTAFILDLNFRQVLLEDQPTTSVAVDIDPAQPAYVIYTSGSTGQPKGVMVSHQALNNLCHWHIDQYQCDSHSVATLVASVGFDAAQWECWPYVLCGGQLVVIDDDTRASATALTACLARNQVSHCFLPTGLLAALAPVGTFAGLDTLRYLLVGGDRLGRGYTEHLAGITLVNHYGPTEAAVVSTSYLVKPQAHEEHPPIGQPIYNSHCYVLNEQLQLQPIGVTGELCIGGDNLAIGYLNNEALTEQAFIANPWGEGRLYKTGDMVRWQADGSIAFVGRRDDQVKLRGFRIELGEIEAALVDCQAVSDALVLIKGEPQQLVAYIIEADDSQPAESHQLSQLLHQTLPSYMVPSHYMTLNQWPMTANGKIDRQGLPLPDARSGSDQQYVAPTNAFERGLCDIWQHLLEEDKIGIHDNFFDLGGHSLNAVRLVAEIHQRWQVDIAIRTIFDHRTIAALAQIIGQADRSNVPPIEPAPQTVQLPLSFAQQRLWLLDQISPMSSQYVINSTLTLTGALNVAALQQALDALVVRHQILRTRYFANDQGKAFQVVDAVDGVSVNMVCEDFSALTAEQQHHQAVKQIEAQTDQPFNLSEDLMLRVLLIKLASDQQLLSVDIHHIAFDGWSMNILINELSALYNAFASDQPNPLTSLAIQYYDYAYWQRQWLTGEVLEQQLGYWKTQLDGLPLVHNLRLDHPRPAVADFVGSMVQHTLPIALKTGLNTLAKTQGVTLFMLLNSALACLLSRYSGVDDIVIGSPVANREQPEIAPLIGFFINTLVMRSDLSGDPLFTKLLGQTKQRCLDAYAHQQVPFEQLVDELQVERTLSQNPLFQVMLTLHNFAETSLNLNAVEVANFDTAHTKAQFDISLNVLEDDSGIHLVWEYASALFDQQTIVSMSQHFETLLRNIVATPTQRLSELSLIDDKEQHQLRHQFNQTVADYDEQSTIHALFEAQTSATPQAIALVWGDEQLSYQALNTQANQLAHHLVGLGVKPETLVAVCAQRSMTMVVALLAILKAGGAYVPFDPSAPSKRLQGIIDDADIQLLLTQDDVQAQTQLQVATVISLDEHEQAWANASQENLDPKALGLNSRHLAYVLFTSGSTGQPKGVMVEHQGLVAMYQGWNSAYDLAGKGYRWLQMANVTFDVFSGDWMRAWCAGGTLVLCPKAVILEPEKLLQIIIEQKIDCAEFVPAVMRLLMDHLEQGEKQNEQQVEQYLAKMALVLVSSDAWSLADHHRLESVCTSTNKTLNKTRVINSYGTTEGVIDTSYFETDDLAPLDRHIEGGFIGKPFANTTIYIVDEDNRLVPRGVIGELCTGGPGLFRGYLNNQQKTASQLVNLTDISGKVYKTGDLAYQLADGSVVLQGRKDNQVKIRGLRLELGEIERCLLIHSAIKEVVVVVCQEPQRLVACMVTDAGTQANASLESQLRTIINDNLPDYMFPSGYIQLDKFPLTGNGKIDRAQLVQLAASSHTGSVDHIEPTGETELAIAQIWQKLLGIEQVSANHSFFDIGGHSLLAVRLMAALKGQFAIAVGLKVIFEFRTISELAQFIDKERALEQLLAQAPAVDSDDANANGDADGNEEDEWLL